MFLNISEAAPQTLEALRQVALFDNAALTRGRSAENLTERSKF